MLPKINDRDKICATIFLYNFIVTLSQAKNVFAITNYYLYIFHRKQLYFEIYAIVRSMTHFDI